MYVCSEFMQACMHACMIHIACMHTCMQSCMHHTYPMQASMHASMNAWYISHARKHACMIYIACMHACMHDIYLNGPSKWRRKQMPSLHAEEGILEQLSVLLHLRGTSRRICGFAREIILFVQERRNCCWLQQQASGSPSVWVLLLAAASRASWKKVEVNNNIKTHAFLLLLLTYSSIDRDTALQVYGFLKRHRCKLHAFVCLFVFSFVYFLLIYFLCFCLPWKSRADKERILTAHSKLTVVFIWMLLRLLLFKPSSISFKLIKAEKVMGLQIDEAAALIAAASFLSSGIQQSWKSLFNCFFCALFRGIGMQMLLHLLTALQSTRVQRAARSQQQSSRFLAIDRRALKAEEQQQWIQVYMCR